MSGTKFVALILIVLTVALTLFASTENAHAAQRAHASVVGGTVAGYGYPWAAYIHSDEAGDEGSCSGSVVATNMVLTAAHCVVNEATSYIHEPGDVEVLIGSPNILSGGHWYKATSIYVDPQYRIGRGPHDAALIELPGPVPAPTITLAERGATAGTGAYFLGWGTTIPPTVGDGEGSTELMLGRTVVQSSAYCRSHGAFNALAELCSIDSPTDASGMCFGDSGGPMFVIVGSEPVEIGINDALASKVGSIPCSPSNPDFEIRADVEAPWVYRIAEEREPVLRVTRDEAIHDTFNVLSTGPFRSHFTGRYQYRVRCREVESSKWQCEPEWGARGNDYWGTVTIYAVWEEGNPVWNFRYRLSWVRDACYVRFRNCPTWTRQH